MKIPAALLPLLLAACATTHRVPSSSDSVQPLSQAEKELICKTMQDKYADEMPSGKKGEQKWEVCVSEGSFHKYKGKYSIYPPGGGGAFLCDGQLNGDEESPEVVYLKCVWHGN